MDISILGASLFIKEGGFLLSRIALQYHRRKWAYLLCSELEEVGPHHNNHLISLFPTVHLRKTACKVDICTHETCFMITLEENYHN